jgi:hypothetical protein
VRLSHSLNLRLPPHETRERTGCEGLEACPRRPGTRQLKDFERLCQPLDSSQAEWFGLHHLVGKPEGLRRQEDAARRGELFHTRR